MKELEEILIEDREIYDGWIAKYNTKTKEVTLRDFWVTQKMSEEKKKELISSYKQMMDNQ